MSEQILTGFVGREAATGAFGGWRMATNAGGVLTFAATTNAFLTNVLKDFVIVARTNASVGNMSFTTAGDWHRTSGHVWGPVSSTPPALEIAKMDATRMQLRLSGDEGLLYQIEESTDLRRWNPVSAVVPTNASLPRAIGGLTVTNDVTLSSRFFRALLAEP
jgi:hypothetical protein